jgi:hypothetical protein
LSLTGFSQITNNMTQNGGDTVITFGQDTTTQLVRKGIDKTTLTASDFIMPNAPISSLPPNPDIPIPSVAITVQIADGYDFSTLYGDLAAGYPGLANGSFAADNTDTHMFLVDAAKGIAFELIGTGFAYNGNHLPSGGTITEIDILGTVQPDDPAQLTRAMCWSTAMAGASVRRTWRAILVSTAARMPTSTAAAYRNV